MSLNLLPVCPSSRLSPTDGRLDWSREATLTHSVAGTYAHVVMDVYVDLCCAFGLPVWIASLLHAAKCLRVDHARRKKVYRLLQRKLMFHRVGVKEGNPRSPTYVYPEEVKMLMHSVFPQDICAYPNPCHDQVVFVTVEDLHKIN